ncbi:MAG: ribonuclease HII [Balneolaceae bacterium]
MNDSIDRLKIEKSLWSQNYKRVMGLDEVGRGCLSGPVVAAGVVLAPGTQQTEYVDSKCIPEAERRRLAARIRKEAVFWTIKSCDPTVIDRINILNASVNAMMQCAESGGNPDFLLIDGNRYASSIIPYQCIVGGDNLSASIGAASILAKVFRDGLMRELHSEYPVYGWDTNVGYPTRKHFEGLKKHGYTPYHRRSFRLRTKRAFTGNGTGYDKSYSGPGA